MRISDWSSDVCSSDLIAAYLSLFKGLGGGVGSGLCGLFAAAHRGRFVREDLLRLVDLGALERLEPRDLVQRQIGEELQELADVAVVAVAPILPIVKMGQLFGIKPHRAGGDRKRPGLNSRH